MAGDNRKVKNLCQFVIVSAVLVAILALFISPVLPLEPTALRAARNAQLFFTALAAAAAAFLYLLRRLPALAGIDEEDQGLQIHPSLVDLNCSRLC